MKRYTIIFTFIHSAIFLAAAISGRSLQPRGRRHELICIRARGDDVEFGMS